MAQTGNDTWNPASGMGGTDGVKSVTGSPPNPSRSYIAIHPELVLVTLAGGTPGKISIH